VYEPFCGHLSTDDAGRCLVRTTRPGRGTVTCSPIIFTGSRSMPPASQPVDIWMDQPLQGSDAMRAANGKLLVAENGSGKISVITVTGDKASVKVIKEGLNTPTAVEPAGDTIWIAERGAGKAVSIPMPK
jgi:hypothetical protein